MPLRFMSGFDVVLHSRIFILGGSPRIMFGVIPHKTKSLIARIQAFLLVMDMKLTIKKDGESMFHESGKSSPPNMSFDRSLSESVARRLEPSISPFNYQNKVPRAEPAALLQPLPPVPALLPPSPPHITQPVPPPVAPLTTPRSSHIRSKGRHRQRHTTIAD